MRHKLPINQNRIIFAAKGKFFLNRLVLELKDGGLFAKGASIERISRFSQNDLQQHLQHSISAESKILFFSNRFNFRKNSNWSYIKREKTLEKASFQLLATIYDSEDICFFLLEYDRICTFSYSRKTDSLNINSQPIDMGGMDSALLNNFLFDPYSSFEEGSQLTEVLIQALGNMIKNTGSHDLIFLGGEYVWSNNLEGIIKLLADRIEVIDGSSPSNLQLQSSGFDLILDRDAIWEALLSEIPEDTELKYLNKEYFHRSLYRVQKLAPAQTVKIQSQDDDIQARELRANADKWIYTHLRTKERFLGAKYRGIVFGFAGKAGINNYPKSEKELLTRSDSSFDYIQEDLKLDIEIKSKSKIKIFDYASPNPLDRLRLEVVDNEKVRKNQRLARYHDIAGLLDKHFSSSTDGRVDLSNIEKGYVVLDGKSTKRSTLSSEGYLKLRPKLILGESVEDLLGEGVIYIPKLYKTDFEMFVQKGKAALIVDSIDRRMFLDIVDFDLSSLMTIVLLGGIDVPAKTNSPLAALEGNAAKIDSETNEIQIFGGENIYADVDQREDLRLNQTIRIIDPENWAVYAKIVSIRNAEVGVKTDVGIDKLSILNII
ncbi:hypothetical protein GF389_05120 [Candidatus Dojkabacteria bacterium]|nr:hypothetical protein [Candidatus Dojkabacteria bacterium]